jgi:L-ascorbate metabolism protein UlaG (beta-lactamase superfamily)
MKITKIGHCCLLIEIDGKRILTDPGAFTVADHVLHDIDIVLISHEHADHLHTDSLKELLRLNPRALIYCNSAVGRLLSEADIAHFVLEGTAYDESAGIHIEAFDAPHAEIYETLGQVQNTGYFIGPSFFYPGDAFADPGKPVQILALPVAGPWCKVGDAVRYALALKPQKAFPVHDGIEREDRVHVFHNTPARVLPEHGIEFVPLKAGESADF